MSQRYRRNPDGSPGTLESAYAWDQRGRLLKVVEYAANGTTVVETGHFAYDALDRRARQTVVGGTHAVDERYVYESGELALVYDLLGGGGATAREKLRERYLNARGVDLVLSVEPLTHSASGANTAAGQASWYLHDHLGTPRDTLRRSSTSPATVQHWQQFRYDAWGRSQGEFAVTTGAPTTPPRIGFTGQVFDVATGLNYYQARYYDPDLGRFLSEDPAGFAAGELNLYRYVGNEPTRLVDPTGRNPARPYELTGLASSAYAMPGIGQSYQAPAGALPWGGTPKPSSQSVSKPLPATAPEVPQDKSWVGWLSSGVKNTAARAQQATTWLRGEAASAVVGWVQGATEGPRSQTTSPQTQAGQVGQQVGAFQRGTAQGLLNIANGVQDIGVGLWNAGLNTSFAGLTLKQGGVDLTIESLDWSYGALTKESPFSHKVSKIVGGESAVTLATAGGSAAVTSLRAPVQAAPRLGTAAERFAANKQAGRAGELAAGIVGPKKGVTSPLAGRMRFPDQLTSEVLRESKNVARQGLTSQIKDYIAVARLRNIPFELWVRKGNGTKISGPLEAAVNAGYVRLIRGI